MGFSKTREMGLGFASPRVSFLVSPREDDGETGGDSPSDQDTYLPTHLQTGKSPSCQRERLGVGTRTSSPECPCAKGNGQSLVEKAS